MKLEILKAELGIVAINNISDLGESYIKEIENNDTKTGDLIFLYLASRDWIVLNKSNSNFEIYFEIIQLYLMLSKKKREEFIKEIHNQHMLRLFYELDAIIDNRKC